MNWLSLAYQCVYFSSLAFVFYCAMIRLPILAGRVLRRFIPPAERRLAFIFSLWLGLFFSAFILIINHTVGYLTFKAFYWTCFAVVLDAYLSHNSDRWKRWGKKMKSKVKFKKFSSKPVWLPAPV